MSSNYSKGLPMGNNGQPKQEFNIPLIAINTSAADNLTTSSIIGLDDNCTDLEVGTSGSGAVLKWISTTNTNPSVISAATTANFDHYIPAGMVRRFVVPVERFVGQYSVVGLNDMNGLYNRVAIKSVGVGSVLTTQY